MIPHATRSTGYAAMVLELHVLGPAFSLPSIDASCIAATAYLRRTLPPDAWVLVPSTLPDNHLVSTLPAIRDGCRWVDGFHSIVAYLRRVSEGKWDLDGRLSREQRADKAALVEPESYLKFKLTVVQLHCAPRVQWSATARPLTVRVE